MNPKRKALLTLHLIVFIWGFTGILGKEISLPAIDLVWWRTLVAFISIGLYIIITRQGLQVSRKSFIKYFLTGIITATHWIFFFASIKASNISTALVVLSTTSLFVAVLGPFVHGAKFKWMELIIGGFIVAGLAIIFKFEPEYHLGIILSLCAALFASLFSLFNANFTKHEKAPTIAFYEMLGGFIGVTGYLLLQDGSPWPASTPTVHEFWLILLLGTAATAFAFIKSIEVVKILHPFTCSITINLEPIYSIIMALWLYGASEYMSGQFYIGAALLILSLFVEAFYRRKE